MRFIVIELTNLIIVGLVFYYPIKKVMLSDFVNRKTKCYFWKDIEGINLTRLQSMLLEIKDGKGRFSNENYLFIDRGIILPITLLLCIWPYYVFLPDNFLSFGFIFCSIVIVVVTWYQLLLVYLRLKRNKSFKLLDENYPYTLNYTCFPLNFNKISIINIALYIFVVYITNSMLAKIILALLLVKMHIYIFMDKVDELLGWNILKKDNLENLASLEGILFSFLFGGAVFILSLTLLNIRI